jgi:hypothetical protein
MALPLRREAYEPRLKMGHFHLTLTGTLYPTADTEMGEGVTTLAQKLC